MSNSAEKPWSTNPFAPQIPYWQYTAEKKYFTGGLLGAILYGVVIVMFFQCLKALFKPVNRREGVRWGLVAYTVAIFTTVTTFIALNLQIISLSYIDNRNFPGGGAAPPGPLGYSLYLYSKPIFIVDDAAFILNNWLADGLLLWRCYVIFSQSYLVIAFPVLLYLASVAMSISTVYAMSQPDSYTTSANLLIRLGHSYFSLSLALNVILTSMIVIRLYLHNRDLKSSTVSLSKAGGGTYTIIAAMLVESCALYAVALITYVAPWAAKEYIQDIFLLILANVQAIAPYLIIIRVANRKAFAANVTGSTTSGTLNFRSQRTATSDGGYTTASGHHLTFAPGCGKDDGKDAGSELGVVKAIEFKYEEV